MENQISKLETKREKFVRLTERRVNAILDQFRKLGNLSNTRSYEYNDEDVKKIFSRLTRELKKTKTLFLNSKNPKINKFKL